ncbi:MAG: HEPN domain-containing protein [Gaiellaceae bacterium]
MFGPYWAALASQSFYLDHRFTMVAQCAEAYVGRRKTKPKLTFEQRIRYLLESTPRAVRSQLPPSKEFAKEVVWARNHLVHRDARSSRRAATGARLWAMTEIVKFIYDVAILRELRFTQAEIARLVSFERNRRIDGILRRALEVWNETTPGR